VGIRAARQQLAKQAHRARDFVQLCETSGILKRLE